jgi:hypothetical protein
MDQRCKARDNSKMHRMSEILVSTCVRSCREQGERGIVEDRGSCPNHTATIKLIFTTFRLHFRLTLTFFIPFLGTCVVFDMHSQGRPRTVSGKTLFHRKYAVSNLKTPVDRQPVLSIPLTKSRTLRHSDRREEEPRIYKRRQHDKRSPPRVDLAEQFLGRLQPMSVFSWLNCK